MDLRGAINGAARRIPPWTIYVAGFGWSAWLFYLAASGRMGADPVKLLERSLGKLGLQLLIAGLAITPLRVWAGLNLLRFRRAIGLTAFYYIAMHLLAWIILDMGLLVGQAFGDIAKRPYITVGMAGLLLLIPLALTSNDRMVRRLGPARWRALHRLTYAAALLGGLHYIWQAKAWPLEPLLYFAAIALLLALRWRPARRQPAGQALRTAR